MNRLDPAQRAQILGMLCEGMSMRAVSRLIDVSINTVSKLLVDAGLACARFHDENVRNVRARRVQCDEIWSFCYAKAKNVALIDAAAPPAKRGLLQTPSIGIRVIHSRLTRESCRYWYDRFWSGARRRGKERRGLKC